MTDDAVKTAAGRVADFRAYLVEATGYAFDSVDGIVEAATPVIVAQALYESEHAHA